MLYMFSNIAVFVIQHIIFRVSPAEPVCIDLVHNRSLRPVRGREPRTDPEPCGAVRMLGDPPLIQDDPHRSADDLKAVAHGLAPHVYLRRVIIKKP